MFIDNFTQFYSSFLRNIEKYQDKMLSYFGLSGWQILEFDTHT